MTEEDECRLAFKAAKELLDEKCGEETGEECKTALLASADLIVDKCIVPQRIPVESDAWKTVRKHGVGLEDLDIFWKIKPGGVRVLDLRWRKHLLKEKTEAIASDLRAEGYTVTMSGKV